MNVALSWPSVAVVGAGAVGCYFGGMLARAGAPVTLIGRASHVDAIGRNGLAIEIAGRHERIDVRATTDPAGVGEAELVLVCVKTPDTEAAAVQVRPHLRPDARVLSLQNGVDNARRLRGVLEQPLFAAVVYVGVVMSGPGQVRHTGRGDLVVGPLPGEAARDPRLWTLCRDLAATFERAGVPCVVSTDIEAALWTKLAINCVFNAISALGVAPYGRMLQSPGFRALMPIIVAELCEVARADGIALEREALIEACRNVGSAMSAQMSSTAQDVLREKPTEIDALNGYVVRRGEAHGIATPVNRTLHALVKLRETAFPATGPANAAGGTRPAG